MKALVHIGLPKTGSSSIQQFLWLNREALAARGLRYARFNPRLGSQMELAATALALSGAAVPQGTGRLVLGLRGDGDDAALAARFLDWLDTQRAGWPEARFVASSEHLQAWLHRPAFIRALDSFLGERFTSVEYLLYLRPQADLLLSSYSERIRRGEALSLARHLDERPRALDFDAIVTRWEEALGAGRLHLRLLHPDALTGGALIPDFCDALGLSPEGLAEPARMNPSLGAAELAFRRRLNRLLPVRLADGRRNPWDLRALALWRRMRPEADAPLALSPDQRARIEALHAESNERLRARHFPARPTLF